MGKVGAQITMSLDGYVTGSNDGPERGLGEGGERLHYWVFGGPWSYDEPPTGEATGVDKELLDEFELIGAVIGGRWTYEAAGAWGGTNPWGKPFFILTHRHEDELVVSVAPVVLGSGKRLFEGFDKDVALEQVGVVQSPWVTHLRYRVLPA